MTGSRGKMAGARAGEQKHRRDANAYLAVRCYLNRRGCLRKGLVAGNDIAKVLDGFRPGKGGVEAIRDRRLFFSLSLSHSLTFALV